MRGVRVILRGTRCIHLILIIFGLVTLVEIFTVLYNPQVINAQPIIDLIFNSLSMLSGTSETVCVLSICGLIGNGDLKFRQWLAGVVDNYSNLLNEESNELIIILESIDTSLFSIVAVKSSLKNNQIKNMFLDANPTSASEVKSKFREEKRSQMAKIL